MNMNYSRVLTGVLLQGIKPTFASSSGLLAQQTRNTFILQRKYPMRLHAKGAKPHRFRSKNWIYEMVEDTDVRKDKLIDVILTSYVTGVGSKGEKISMKPHQAYNKVLLPGLAVYASPENIEKYKHEMEKAKNELPTYSSPWVPRTMTTLSQLLVSVVVSKNHPWTLEKYHIRAAFRKCNIHVPDDAITMPKQKITGPDLEIQNKEFYITVTINKREEVKVRCRIHHFTLIETDKIPYTEFWKKPSMAIFPEDQPILDSMPKHPLCEIGNTIQTV